MSGTLYLVATPIGNLADMSFRAVEILKSVDMIACEDTRHSKKLLNHYGISKSLVSYHEHNEKQRTAKLLRELSSGRSVALISDAGTPGINDPGEFLVREAIENEIDVVSIPGAVAFVNAVIGSGLPADSIFFGGFLPSKKGDRLRRLDELKQVPATLVFYESPHRLVRSLSDCVAVLGDRQAVAARELTKLHEEVLRGTLSELVEHFSGASPRGEFVLVIDRAGDEKPPSALDDLNERIRELENSGVDAKGALKSAAKEFGISRSEAYRRLQASRNKGT
ncbi:MAG TPA: 16S rRNA (cytidine(1402)-2'-O)-methyltransferase [Pyrinomonadaceae bacterium]|jgi:16S rRNA (cytidine1402-2'-O)-methyltransferase|nr:16S rRNA (cytidine(1402)-2'-O)-methyltransferase [Pyrinomonadaceae bacterium]